MGFEIERKFLVRRDDWRQLVNDRISIRQAYLASSDKASIRVRIEEASAATLTVKSRPYQLRRLELEYPIPVLEAEALMRLRRGAVIEKNAPCGPLRRSLVGNRRVFWRECRSNRCGNRAAPRAPTHRIAGLDWRGSDGIAALLQQLVGGASVFFMAASARGRVDRKARINPKIAPARSIDRPAG